MPPKGRVGRHGKRSSTVALVLLMLLMLSIVLLMLLALGILSLPVGSDNVPSLTDRIKFKRLTIDSYISSLLLSFIFPPFLALSGGIY